MSLNQLHSRLNASIVHQLGGTAETIYIHAAVGKRSNRESEWGFETLCEIEPQRERGMKGKQKWRHMALKYRI